MSDIRNIINLLEGVQQGENLEEISRLAKAVAAGSIGLMTAMGTPGASKADTIDVGGQHVVVSKSPKGERLTWAINNLFDLFDQHYPGIRKDISKAEMARLLDKAEDMENPSVQWFKPDPNRPIAAQIEAHMIDGPENVDSVD